MRKCSLCQTVIPPNAPVHAISGNHWHCEVKADRVPGWQRLLADELAKLPARDSTDNGPLPFDRCPLCGENRNDHGALIRGGHRC